MALVQQRHEPARGSGRRRAVFPVLLLALVAALLTLDPGVRPAAGQDGPSVTGVAVTSDAGDDNTYALGETIRVTLTFSEAVDVTGSPRLKIDMDPAPWGEKWAVYETGSGTGSLTFAHTVVEPNYSSRGIAVVADSLEVNGGTIRSASSQTAAALSHTGRDHDADHKVDWQQAPPTPTTTTTTTTTPTTTTTTTTPTTTTPPASESSALRVSISSSPAEPSVNEAAVLTATIANAPSGSDPSYNWEIETGGEWSSAGRNATFSFLAANWESWTFRLTVSYGSGDSAASDPLTVTWVNPNNQAPVVNTEVANYEKFTKPMNVPRGTLVSKSFNQVFSDPDGDDLTFSVSVPEEHRELVDQLALALTDPRPPHLAHPDAFPRVFIRPDAAGDWKAVSPALPDPLTLTVTVTATDPGGLSASVDSHFVVDWESDEPVTQLSLRANAVGPQDSAPSGTPEQNNEDAATNPTVTGVEVTSDAGSDDTYQLGDTIQISLTFSETVDVTGSPRLKIDMDPAEWGTKVVPYESGTGTDTLTFAHVVVEPNYSTQGIAVLENTLDLNGGTIKSASSEMAAALAHDGLGHQGEHRVSWLLPAQRPEAPTITEVRISSAAGSDRSYAKGEVIRVTLRLSEAVTVTGTPRIKLDFRTGTGDEQWANFESGSGTTSLVFAYTVAAGDDSDDGVAVPANSLELNSGAIVSTSDTSVNALLSHTGLVRDPNHRVDCTEPTLLAAVADGTTLTLTFDEALGAAASLSNDRFAVVRTPQGGSEESIGLTGSPAISSVSVTLTLASAVLDTDTDVKVSYTKPTTGDNNRLIDLAGNEADSFSDVSAMKDTTPPRLVSGQVDGDKVILYFSEALDETSTGGWFRVSITLYSGARVSFIARGGVEIKGNKVTVGLGLSTGGNRLVAKAGVTRNTFYYYKDDSFGANVLRDLAGNPVETPVYWHGYHETRIITLENITVGPPRVTWVDFSSDPGEDATYGLGDTINVRVTFNQPVIVVGEPRLRIAYDTGVGARLAEENKWAVYSGGSGTSALVFSYTVGEVENSLNISPRGVAVIRNTLTGGTIRSVESSQDADRSHMGVGHNQGHKVDIPLRLKRAELSGTTLTIHFNQPLGEARSLSNSAFVVRKTVAGGSVRTIGLRGSPLISGHTLTLKLSSGLSYTDYDLNVSYNKPGSGSGNKLVDTAGAELASFSDQSVGADVTPPTLIRAEVNANMVTLFFNEPLDGRYNRDHRFRVKMTVRTFHVDESTPDRDVVPVEWVREFTVERDVQINGHRVTFRTGGGDPYSARPGLDIDSRVYYYKRNEDTRPGLRDLAGNEVAIPHYNPGFWSTRWVHTVNVTR